MARRTQGEGSVYLRKDGRAAASAMYEGKRITKYGKTKTEAKQKLDAYLSELKTGKVVIGPKQTVEQYLTGWLENRHRLGIELTTLDQHRSTLRAHLIPTFGYLQLTGLTSDRIQAFYAAMIDAGYASATVRRIHAVLSCALSDAVLRKDISQNPCQHVKLPKLGKHRPKVLSSEECSRLIAVARGHRLWFMLLVALTTGLRLGELCALHWEDFDLSAMRIHVHRSKAYVAGQGQIEKSPKSRSSNRRVILAKSVVDAMEAHKAYVADVRDRAGDRWCEMGLVFPNKYGKHLVGQQVEKECHALLAKAGIEPRKFHDLRHSAATLLFAAGINPKVVSEALGHSQVSTTLDLYGDVTPDMQQDVADVMNRLFGEL